MIGRVRTALLAALLVIGLTAPALAQKPVKIGVLTPLSPPGDAAAGQFIVYGLETGEITLLELVPSKWTTTSASATS